METIKYPSVIDLSTGSPILPKFVDKSNNMASSIETDDVKNAERTERQDMYSG